MFEFFGFIAAFLTTVAFIPQVYKIYKTNKTSDLSLLTFSLFTIGVFNWLLYGIYLLSYPMIVANIITFALALYILYKIIKNKRASRRRGKPFLK